MHLRGVCKLLDCPPAVCAAGADQTVNCSVNPVPVVVVDRYRAVTFDPPVGFDWFLFAHCLWITLQWSYMGLVCVRLLELKVDQCEDR